MLSTKKVVRISRGKDKAWIGIWENADGEIETMSGTYEQVHQYATSTLPQYEIISATLFEQVVLDALEEFGNVADLTNIAQVIWPPTGLIPGFRRLLKRVLKRLEENGFVAKSKDKGAEVWSLIE
jgi:putative heme iron utilization protein